LQNALTCDDQDAYIDRWIAGYKKGLSPHFTIPKEGWGAGWSAGETVKIPDPRLEFLNTMFEKVPSTVGDKDEVQHFIDWVNNELET
jgi:hypothetical protein